MAQALRLILSGSDVADAHVRLLPDVPIHTLYQINKPSA